MIRRRPRRPREGLGGAPIVASAHQRSAFFARFCELRGRGARILLSNVGHADFFASTSPKLRSNLLYRNVAAPSRERELRLGQSRGRHVDERDRVGRVQRDKRVRPRLFEIAA